MNIEAEIKKLESEESAKITKMGLPPGSTLPIYQNKIKVLKSKIIELKVFHEIKTDVQLKDYRKEKLLEMRQQKEANKGKVKVREFPLCIYESEVEWF